MTSQVTLSAKTFGKSAQKEVVNHLPFAKHFKKSHVAGVGYVFFIYNTVNEKIGQCFRDGETMKLNILN